MTKKAQDAYMIGFCKTAEAHGTDPEALYKYAQGLRSAKEFANVLTAAKNSSLAGAFGLGMKHGWNTSILGRTLNPVFRPVGRMLRSAGRAVRGFFKPKPDYNQQFIDYMKAYAAKAKAGIAPTPQDAMTGLGKLLLAQYAHLGGVPRSVSRRVIGDAYKTLTGDTWHWKN